MTVLLPTDIEAERSILGAVLVSPSLLIEAQDKLQPSDFYAERERSVYAAMLALSVNGVSVDPVTLKNELQRTMPDKLWPAYIAGLVDGVPRVESLEGWIGIVRRCSVQRALSKAALNIQAQVGESESTEAALEMALREIMRVTEASSSSDSFASPDVALKDAFAVLDAMATSDGVYGLPTGLSEFDDTCSGLRPQQLVVIAARPAQGKTAAALTVADNVAAAGKRVAFFSCEMSRRELTMRRLVMRSGVDIEAIKHALRTNNEKLQEAISKTYARLASDGLFIDETPALTVQQVRSRARRLAFERGKLDLVVVDYLQLLRGDRPENRQQEIANIARGLKNLAKELDVPVIALSQLNRESEKRDNKRPILSDLRESGEIEQAADVIVFLYRDEQEVNLGEGERAEWIVAKQRNGPTRTCHVRFFPMLTTFKDDTAGDGL